MNDENLKGPFTPKEARDFGAKGGKASGESKRKKKAMKEYLALILDKDLDENSPAVKAMQEKFGDKIDTQAGAVMAVMVNKALHGDLRAIEDILELSGEQARSMPLVHLDIENGEDLKKAFWEENENGETSK